MHRLLAIDPGARCGWAWTEGPRPVAEQSGVWELGKIDDPGRRFAVLFDQLSEFAPTHVVYEEPQGLRGVQAWRWHGGYQATVSLWCHQHRVTMGMVGPTSLKVFATGSGRARKPAMMAAARDRLDLALPLDADDNRVDALWLLAWGLSSLGLDKGTLCRSAR